MVRSAIVALIACLVATPALAQTSPAPRDSARLGTESAAAPATQTFTVPSFRSLFTDLGQDVRRLGSRNTALVLGVAAGLGAAVHSQDARLTRRAAQSTRLDSVFEIGAVSGGGLVQVGGAFGAYAIGRALDNPLVATVGADLVRAQLMTAVFTHGLKLSVGRRRPDGTRFSFPSGHTSATFATATVLQRHFGWKVGVPAYAFASYVAGSRLQENKHYASDVIVGAALGIVSGRAVTVGRGRATFAVSPFASRGGAGIGFTLVGAQ